MLKFRPNHCENCDSTDVLALVNGDFSCGSCITTLVSRHPLARVVDLARIDPTRLQPAYAQAG